ncbi:MAG: type VI secretion system tip protein VgrG [Flavobacteriales bacterium]|nr:type VI secretion system tip protein VgrG [Flavobacteriales bacterium]
MNKKNKGKADLQIVLNSTVQTKYLIESIQVTKEVNKISQAKLVLLDSSWDTTEFLVSNEDSFIPGKEVEIIAQYDNNKEVLFKGIVIKHGVRVNREGNNILTLTLKDESVKMTINRKNKHFRDKTDSAIILDILDENGIESEVESTTVTNSEMVQYNSTDWDFIVARAEANGKVVLVDEGKVKISAPAITPNGKLELENGLNIFAFNAEIDARDQFEKVSAKSWDESTQALNEKKSRLPSLTEAGNLSGKDISKAIGTSIYEVQHQGRLSKEELQEWANTKLLRSRLAKIKGTVTIAGTEEILPGDVVTVKGIGERFDGPVYVSGVRHHFSNDMSWYTHIQFGLDQNWLVKKVDDIIDQPAAGLLPAMHGLQIGIVTNIHEDPDGEARVQIKLPMIDINGEGIWARIGTLDAGNQRGSFFRPEVDDEVVVGFLNDDPRSPIILGMLHSSKLAPPIEPSEENNEKGFVTRSGIKFLFDDTEEESKITLETPKGNQLIIDDKEESISITDLHGNTLLMSADGINIESIADLNITASGDINIEGANIINSTNGQFSADGTSGLDLSSSGPSNISGTPVSIN